MPAVQRPASRESRPASAVIKPAFWLGSANECRAEKVLMGMLVVAAVGGIAYGFSCLVNLVQGWASFYAGVGHFF